HEVENRVQVAKAVAEAVPVVDAGLDELGEFLELDSADGGLDVEGLEVVAEMGVGEFVVVAFGQFAQLPVEAFAAGVVHAAGAPAVPAPVAKALDDGLEFEALDD